MNKLEQIDAFIKEKSDENTDELLETRKQFYFKFNWLKSKIEYKVASTAQEIRNRILQIATFPLFLVPALSETTIIAPGYLFNIFY